MFDLLNGLEDFFGNTLVPFTLDDFRLFLKKQKMKYSKDEALRLLLDSDYIFSLVDEMFITRAGVFTNQLFSFCPTKEEVDCGAFIPGHRLMPFIDPMICPYYTTFVFRNTILAHKEINISMNAALDINAFFGEGYVIPVILGDPANKDVALSSIPYGMPSRVDMTAYNLEPLIKEGFEFGDRLVCKVLDWSKTIVSIDFEKGNHGSFKLTREDMEREDWYSRFEEAFLEKFEKTGPCRSIEEQLAFLFLEEQSSLCVPNCGSSEEFLRHTTKIDFGNYGVESRIWRTGETIPFVGTWNQEALEHHGKTDLAPYYTDLLLDSFIKDSLVKTNMEGNLEEITNRLFPPSMQMTDFEMKVLMLNLEKRIDIVKSRFNRFNDFPVTPVRTNILKLFSRVISLMGTIFCSSINLADLPQPELVILTQIMNHVVRLTEELESDPVTAANQKEEISLSLNGMRETFDDIETTLKMAVKKLEKQAIKKN